MHLVEIIILLQTKYTKLKIADISDMFTTQNLSLYIYKYDKNIYVYMFFLRIL